MRYVSSTELKQRLGAVLEAAQQEPVMVRRHDREIAVVLSPREYERLRDAGIAEFQRYCDRVSAQAAARGMTEEKLQQLLSEDE